MEKRIQRKFIKEVESRGGRAVKFHAEARRGWPDLLILMPGGRVLFVEVKTPTGRLHPLQERVIGQIRELGCEVYVCSDLEEFKRILKV